MNYQNICNLIQIRDFAVKIFDNINFNMNKDEVKQLRVKINVMDKLILKEILSLQLSNND